MKIESKLTKKELKELAEKNKKKAKKTAEEFKAFAFKGNIIYMSVGVIIGTAFTKIVNSLVSEIITPALSIFTDKIDFNKFFIALDGNYYESIEAAKEAGIATINYGTFITNFIDFILIALVVFFFLKFFVNKLKKQEPQKEEPAKPKTKTCPFCKTDIHIEATRCPNCTSILESEASENEESN